MNALPIAAATLGTVAGAAAKGSPTVAFFSDVLASGMQRLSANAGQSASACSARTSASASSASRLEDRLAAKIQTLLDAGVSLASIVSHLAQAIGAHLGGGDPEARAAATQAAVQQLSGASPPGAPSGARALAGRLRAIAEWLTGAGDEQGQQQRRAGTILDAETAKDNPALTQTNVTANTAGLVSLPGLPSQTGALASVKNPLGGASASGAVRALADGALPAAAAFTAAQAADAFSAQQAAAQHPGGDLARVATDLAGRIGTGGTSLLGRVLGRATNAALEREANAQANAAAPASGDAATEAASNVLASGNHVPLPGTLTTLLERFESILTAVQTPHATLPPDVQLTHRDTPDATTALDAVAPPPGPALVATHDAAPAPPPAPAAPADPYNVVDQVIRGVFVRSVGSNSEIRLRLLPENLGDVTVKLVVHGGAVDATLMTQSAGARDALAAGQAQLGRALADAGLKLQSFSVDLSGNAFAGFPQHQQTGEHRNLPVRRFAASSDDEGGSEPIEALSGAGTQDVPPAPGALDTLV